VVQQTAANAEESASASEQMSAQAEQMKGVVEELAAIVGRSTEDSAGSGARATLISNEARTSVHRTLAAPVKMLRDKGGAVHEQKEAAPDEVIPIASGPEWSTPRRDEGEFKDF
jgi:methyl-accepting chemotaxis protein